MSVNWDVNGDGTADFQFVVNVGGGTETNGTPYAFSIGGIYGLGTYGSGTSTTRTVGYVSTYGTYASRLAVGTAINSTSAFVYKAQYLTILGSRFNGKSYGALRTKGYVGFEFAAADGEHFGYIDLRSTVAGTGTTDANYTSGLVFYNASYETTPGKAITIAAVPEPTSLAALAFGAAGVAGAAVYRRKKAAAQPAA